MPLASLYTAIQIRRQTHGRPWERWIYRPAEAVPPTVTRPPWRYAPRQRREPERITTYQRAVSYALTNLPGQPERAAARATAAEGILQFHLSSGVAGPALRRLGFTPAQIRRLIQGHRRPEGVTRRGARPVFTAIDEAFNGTG